MVRRYIYCLVLIIISIQSYSQTEYRKHISYVIKKSQLDSTFRFISIKSKSDTVISDITYFGKTENNVKVFYISETFPSARVRHGYVMLYLIDSKGKNYLYHDIDKPFNLENGTIIFKHLDKFGKLYYYKVDLNVEVPLFICQDEEDCYNYLIE